MWTLNPGVIANIGTRRSYLYNLQDQETLTVLRVDLGVFSFLSGRLGGSPEKMCLQIDWGVFGTTQTIYNAALCT